MKGTTIGQENSGSGHRIRVHNHHHWKILSPAAKRRAVDMLQKVLGMSERLACKAVGRPRSPPISVFGTRPGWQRGQRLLQVRDVSLWLLSINAGRLCSDRR